MSIHALWWILLVATLLSLLYNVNAYLRYRRGATPLPTYAVGNVSPGLGLLLLILSGLLGMSGALAQISLTASVLLTGVSIVLFIRALRRVNVAER